jgi:hypothetical protein
LSLIGSERSPERSMERSAECGWERISEPFGAWLGRVHSLESHLFGVFSPLSF